MDGWMSKRFKIGHRNMQLWPPGGVVSHRFSLQVVIDAVCLWTYVAHVHIYLKCKLKCYDVTWCDGNGILCKCLSVNLVTLCCYNVKRSFCCEWSKKHHQVARWDDMTLRSQWWSECQHHRRRAGHFGSASKLGPLFLSPAHVKTPHLAGSVWSSWSESLWEGEKQIKI